MFMEFSSLHPAIPDELRNTIMGSRLPSRTADFISDGMGFSDVEKFLLMTIPALCDRMDFLTVIMNREIEVAKLGMKIHSEVQEAMGDSQREFYLREQLRTIKRELGDMGSGNDIAEVNRFIKQFKQMQELTKKMPGLMGGKKRHGNPFGGLGGRFPGGRGGFPF